MDRKIKMADVKAAVNEAYEKYKTLEDGSVDPRVAGMNDGKYGISVRLVNGGKIDLGDTDAQFPMVGLSRIPVAIQLLTQMNVEDLVMKMGMGKKCCCKRREAPDNKHENIHIHGVRAVSMVEPVGDYDGKMEILSNLMVDLMGTSPILDDNLYKTAQQNNIANNVINTMAAENIEIYDSADIAVDMYARLRSMLVNTAQLAEMGSTIAADGINPDTHQSVFDGSLSATVCSMIAVKGPKKMGKPWMIMTGTPAMSCYAGGFIAVIPGFGSIAAFSPKINDAHVPVKAAMAVKDIINRLQLNAFSSARVEVVD